MIESVEAALSVRTDLDAYHSAKRTLYALQLSLNLEDIHTVAASALTDGPDDKSCDLIYVDRSLGQAVVAQGYEAGNLTQRSAPQNKAASLHQAVNWLIANDMSTLPERLRSAAVELHDALEDNAIQQLQLWFVHNLPESVNIRKELQAIANGAKRLISQRYPTAPIDSVVGVEVGRATLANWYLGSQTPILVTDEMNLAVSGAFVEKGDNWRAICTSLDGSWLFDQYQKHQDKIFSANVRGYLGSTRSKNNINNGIKHTAQAIPQQFWPYNNGLTALVNTFEYSRRKRLLTIRGLAIVNGAQTTGALGSLDRETAANTKVLARFIECADATTVRNIIRYNNRQNATEAADFRSNDPIQTRLVREFQALGVVGYSGGRRGGAEDTIRRPAENMIAATVAAQALAAFHREPGVAYHEKGALWESNHHYNRFFSERTTASHILFCYSLLRAVEEAKLELLARPEAERTDSERKLVQFFRQRGSTFLMVAAMGDVAEIYLDRQVADRFRLQFNRAITVPVAVGYWRALLPPALALAKQTLAPVLEREGSLRKTEPVGKALGEFRSLFEATSEANRPKYKEFAAIAGLAS